ncbi:leucine-rich single-pass membrane protein 1-like [Salminus brasiliensis]|uniref:leucine-rich single-pass membrane protein 1-like n=1 Tax=Salminus brasiliensis TaxID=930266 RepID=UPI003B8371C9
MQEISLDLDFLDQERKLYTSDSLNNLHKMKVCTNLQDLFLGPPVSQQASPEPEPEGQRNVNQEILNVGSLPATQLADARSDEDYGDRHSEISHAKAHSILIIIFILSLALILLASLALSAYALYLIAQSNEKMGDVSRVQQLHRKYLEEIREWKTIIQQVLHHSSALQAK